MFSIFFIVGGAVMVGLVLAVFITRSKGSPVIEMVPPEDDWEKTSTIPEVTPAELLELGERLCVENGLVVKERLNNKPTEIYWIAESQNDFFFGNYVLCFFLTSTESPFVHLTDLLEFKDFVKSMSSTKGFFFTNGYFTRDVHQPLEGPRVALYNRTKVINERKRLKLS